MTNFIRLVKCLVFLMNQHVLRRVFAQGQLQSSPSTYHYCRCCALKLIDGLWLFIRRYDNEPAKFLCSTIGCGDDDDDDKVKVDKLVGGCVKLYNGIQECCSTSIVCGMN